MIRVEYNDFIKKGITTNIIDSEEVSFLCGQKTLTDWKTALFFKDKKLEFTDNRKKVNL